MSLSGRSSKPVRGRPRPRCGPSRPELELRESFKGRRFARRKELPLPLRVELAGSLGMLPARTVSLSRAGCLFRIDAPGLCTADGRVAGLTRFTEAMRAHFGRGLRVAFGGGVVTRRMEIVRTTLGGLGGLSVPLLGCRFSCPLTPEESALLGLRMRPVTMLAVETWTSR